MLGPSGVCSGGAGGLGAVKAIHSGGSHPCVVNECADAVANSRHFQKKIVHHEPLHPYLPSLCRVKAVVLLAHNVAE